MSTVRLSDVIVPSVYQDYMRIDSPEVTRFFESGIIERNPLLDTLADGPSPSVEIPFWKDIDATDEPNVSSDDPAAKSIPSKLGTGKQTGRNAYLNKSWSSMDLVKELAGTDPVGEIVAKTNRYWARQWQRRLIASCVGIYLSNVANNSSDMVYSITKASGSPDSANKFGGTAAVRTMLTMGDALGEIGAMGVHSVVYGKMLEDSLITFIQPQNGPGQIPTYQGKVVIYDDGMPVEVDGNGNTIYTSIFFGPGVFGYGEGSPRVPVETDRDPSSGNGGGEEILYERRTFLLHPAGFAFNSTGNVAGQSATLTELKAAAPWTRVIERKNVPLAFLRTNG